MDRIALWRELGQQLRVDSVRAVDAAGSGHPTSSMSAADLMAVLVADHLRYDFDRPDDPGNDHLVFSKGHASPLLYAIYRAVGAVTDEELLSFRKSGSRLQGHPTPALPWVDVATGSLGQGLPISVGIALAARLDGVPARVWVLCGDSEMAEGSMWEAFEHAAFMGLDNLTAIVDVNRLGQRGETMYGWDVDAYVERTRGFGWNAIAIDGHDPAQIDSAYAKAAATEGAPTVIVARTVKGKGVASVENRDGFHGKALPDAEAAVAELGGRREVEFTVARPPSPARPARPSPAPAGRVEYEVGDRVATRAAYGAALAELGARRPEVVALDAEVSNSTYAEVFQQRHPERFLEMYIAEQQMVASAIGLQVRKWAPFASSFAAFLSRATDFVRMAAVSQADIRLAGSHGGVFIGEDGPSQMALEDLALFRAVHGSTVLYPSDANQAARLVEAMADRPGVVYMRTTREKTPVLYAGSEEFPIGGARTVRSSEGDDVTIVGAGVTVHEGLAAADLLAAEGISACVVDLYTVKPLDAATVRRHGRRTGLVVTAEDHWVEGGLGEAVTAALADGADTPRITRLAVRDMPGSATPAEQVAAAGIDAAAIAAAARDLLSG